MTFQRLVLMLLIIAGCSSNDKRPNEPWARPLTEADRAAWGQICDGNFEHKLLGEGPSRVESYIYNSVGGYSPTTGDDTHPKAKCELIWHPRREQVLSLTVRVSFNSQPTGAQIEPYLQIITRELPDNLADDVAAVMRATPGQPLLGTRIGEFSIGGGYDHMNGWMMNVTLAGGL